MISTFIAVAAIAAEAVTFDGVVPNLEDATLETFQTEVYGRRPVERPSEMTFEDVYPPEPFSRPNRNVDAVRRVVECRYRGPYGEDAFRITAFLPKDAKGPVPAFLFINIGNPGLHADVWQSVRSEFWPVEEITDRGYAAIAFNYEDVAPDTYDNSTAYRFGVFRCFEKPGEPRAPDAWGSLSAWAWGASRVMDWIETCPEIDAKHVAVVGHSRGGKAALVAGVTDRRFALTVSNGSGCCGAKLNHADLPRSEHLTNILGVVSYWFCSNLQKWNGRESEMPFDQHQWLSLIAPRLLYIASGALDYWAGPEGEKAAVDLARPAWGARASQDVGYHVHEGGHALGLEDWTKFMDFTDAHGWVAVPPVRLPALVPKPRMACLTGGRLIVMTATSHPKKDWYDFDQLGQCLSEVPMTERTDATIPAEGYRLDVTSGGVTISSSDAAGAFYARQTLRQLAALTATNAASIPCCKVEDWPQYRWRGVLLDETRHFFGKGVVKRLIGQMAQHKMNVLHWHLTDDQGWRLDIPGHPELVRYGAVRPESVVFGTHARWLPPTKRIEQEYDGECYGPYFYSVDDVREVLAFAKANNVMVVPEIEMPGHVRAFLAAYPECSCCGPDLPRVPRCGNSVEENVLCVGNDKSIRLFQEILDRVCELFPDVPYVHIGGDECPRVRWKECSKCRARMEAEGLKDADGLQAWFTGRMVRHLEGRGRRAVGWDEVLAGDVPSSTVGMTWRANAKGGAGNRYVSTLDAVVRGHDMVMTPRAFCYLDRTQGLRDDPHPYYFPWTGDELTLEKVYAFDPCADIPADMRGHIIGGQASCWSESTFNVFDLDWKTWPRACAIAEVLWLGDSKPKFGDFRLRMESHRRRLIEAGVNCAPLATPKYDIKIR